MLSWICVLTTRMGTKWTYKALQSQRNCSSSHNLPARDTLSPVRADVQPTLADSGRMKAIGYYLGPVPFDNAVPMNTPCAPTSWERVRNLEFRGFSRLIF